MTSTRCPDHCEDALEASLRAVPLNELEVYYPALAAAVREWIKKKMPPMSYPPPGYELTERQYQYNRGLATVAQKLGL